MLELIVLYLPTSRMVGFLIDVTGGTEALEVRYGSPYNGLYLGRLSPWIAAPPSGWYRQLKTQRFDGCVGVRVCAPISAEEWIPSSSLLHGMPAYSFPLGSHTY